MSDLKEAWNDLKLQTNDLTNISKQEIQLSLTKKSKGTMQGLRKKVLYKLYFCLFFTAAVGILIPLIEQLPAQILLMILLTAYLVGDILLYQEYKELGKHIDLSQDMRCSLVAFRDRIKKVIKYEESIGLAIYPFSASAGFLIGMSEGSADGSYMDKTSDWVALIVALVIVVPLANWAAKKMNQKAFGDYLRRLESNIQEIQHEK